MRACAFPSSGARGGGSVQKRSGGGLWTRQRPHALEARPKGTMRPCVARAGGGVPCVRQSASLLRWRCDSSGQRGLRLGRSRGVVSPGVQCARGRRAARLCDDHDGPQTRRPRAESLAVSESGAAWSLRGAGTAPLVPRRLYMRAAAGDCRTACRLPGRTRGVGSRHFRWAGHARGSRVEGGLAPPPESARPRRVAEGTTL